jgi:hypothetical protein
MRYHKHARGVAPLQQPRVSRIGTPRAGRRRQHHTANQPKQQRQPQQRPPPRSQPRPQGKPDRPHEQIQLPAAVTVEDAGTLPGWCWRAAAHAARRRPGCAAGLHPAHPRSCRPFPGQYRWPSPGADIVSLAEANRLAAGMLARAVPYGVASLPAAASRATLQVMRRLAAAAAGWSRWCRRGQEPVLGGRSSGRGMPFGALGVLPTDVQRRFRLDSASAPALGASA